ncbi:Multidrug resistance protein MdtN [Gimesia panareensis]|uniref:Multidrug resistance protein MdtN n=1 Tax=Gimesia panareensis TaxID=2527978 RepID=A0A518FVW2_9PLAN|nr:HlyD family efflux transporter periplasmic adaptor subunit [Gimesia panareensis]QDV20471.1 Multidrug resistance protein MdtN [Gimesia panareensis]
MDKQNALFLGILMLTGGLVFLGWDFFQPTGLPAGFASSNGRIEAVEINIATKSAGRLESVMVEEGDFVTQGEVLAKMETDVLEAELREAEAELRRSRTAVNAALSSVIQRESEKAAAESLVKQRKAEVELAENRYKRAQRLLKSSAISTDEMESERSRFFGTQATLDAANARVAGADAAINTAKSQVIQAEAAVGAAQARIEQLQADIDDCTLNSPRTGRIQYRIAQPGEVLSAGGKVLNLVDLGEVYMIFFLPTTAAGQVKMGSEVRLLLDATPQYIIPAKISFVADVAQFTPKSVETAEERQKLMFRIKASIDPGLIKQHIHRVKTGLPGMAYVQLDEQAVWPANLEVRLPE